MRIPLRTENRGRLIPNLFLAVLGPRNMAHFDAIIDTGSDTTIISYKDAGLLQISIKNKPTAKRIQGIGSTEAQICEYNKELTFFLTKEDGTKFKVISQKTYISKEERGANITIIGMDFLKENNLQFFYNPNGVAYLERVEKETEEINK